MFGFRSRKEFQELTTPHVRFLYNMAVRYTGNTYDAEDRSCFNFYKDKGIIVFCNNINFSCFLPVISGDNLKPLLFQKNSGQLFSTLAQVNT